MKGDVMNPWMLAFVAIGVLIAVIGACVVLYHWQKEDQGLRQMGWIFLVAGLAMAAMTVAASRIPSHLGGHPL